MRLQIRKYLFLRIASDAEEYEKNVTLTGTLLSELTAKGIDIFTFVERSWCCPLSNPPEKWVKTKDNIGLLEIKDFESWWSNIGKKTRNMTKKSGKKRSKS